MKFSIMIVCIYLIIVSNSTSQIQFDLNPVWTSTDITNRGTGGAFADINGDGWLDFVVANGNDMDRQHVAVYYNKGDGTFNTTPDWISDDVDYNGHLSIGDVNNDGFPDVAVSVYLGPAQFSQKGKVKIYMNKVGELEKTPSWQSSDSCYTFSCAFGDVNNDGYLDLAVACGESYNGNPDSVRIYLNHNGIIETLPSWKSSENGYAMDVCWADFNNDGMLDLTVGCIHSPNKIYFNTADSLPTTASWSSLDNQQANSTFAADVNNDGWVDLAVSDNNQEGGTGHFKIYYNHNGSIENKPSWESTFDGFGSGINLCDLDNDGYKELITGAWDPGSNYNGAPIMIYKNNAGSFSNVYSWISNASGVNEAIFCADVFNKAVKEHTEILVRRTEKHNVFRLQKSPLQSIIQLKSNNKIIPLKYYCFSLESGWVSIADSAWQNDSIEITYKYSISPDIGTTNWDNSVGNYIFKNNYNPNSVSENDNHNSKVFVYPNPVKNNLNVFIENNNNNITSLEIINLLGEKIMQISTDNLITQTKPLSVNCSSLHDGEYFLLINNNNEIKGIPFLVKK